MICLCMGWERVVCGGREKIFGFRNKNKTKVGFYLLFGGHFGDNNRWVVGLKGMILRFLVCMYFICNYMFQCNRLRNRYLIHHENSHDNGNNVCQLFQPSLHQSNSLL